jgi:hypothetical protein
MSTPPPIKNGATFRKKKARPIAVKMDAKMSKKQLTRLDMFNSIRNNPLEDSFKAEQKKILKQQAYEKRLLVTGLVLCIVGLTICLLTIMMSN